VSDAIWTDSRAVAVSVAGSGLTEGVLRVGVLGLRRGATLARLAQRAGMRVVAVCDRYPHRRAQSAQALDAAAYADVEPFLDHAMDAVILANNFDEHAPVAIRALDRGLSVLSETAACRTIAEGVALIEVAKRSSGVYMFGENYPYTSFSREMRRRYQAGDIGEIRYAEAEYLHAPTDLAWFLGSDHEWRARTPATYYCTHSLTPVISITKTRAVQVSAFIVPTDRGLGALERARRGRGWAALLVMRLDNGAIFKALHGLLAAGQKSWVRIHGDLGLMENLRHGDTRTLRVVRKAVGEPADGPAEEVYVPAPVGFPATADPLGNDVAETLMLQDFASAVRHGVAPDQDVLDGVESSIVGIQAMRSSLVGSVPVEVPDLSRPDVRRAFTADDWFPDLPELRPSMMSGAPDLDTDRSDEDPSGSLTAP
jgi:predicted dehydrogenase